MTPFNGIRQFLSKVWPGDDEVAKKLFVGSSGVAAVKVGGAALGFASHILLARMLSDTGYGIYAYVWSWIVLSANLCLGGYHNLLIRYIPKLRTDEDWSKLRGLLWRSSSTIFGLSTFLSILGILLIALDPQWPPEQYHNVFYVGFVLLPVLTLTLLSQSALKGFKNVVAANLPKLIIRHILVLTICGGFWYLYRPLTAIEAMAVTTAAFAAALLFAVAILRKKLVLDLPKFDYELTYPEKSWFSRSLPFLMISVAVIIRGRIDVIMLGMFEPSSTIAHYNISLQLMSLVGFGLSVVNLTAAPYYSEFFSQNKYGKLQKAVFISAAVASIFALVATVLLVFAGDWALSLFGPSFRNGYEPLMVLAIGTLLSTLCGPIGVLMAMIEKQSTVSRVEIFYTALNIILNVVLISKFGAMGAALATALTIVLRNITLGFILYSEENMNPTMFNWL